MESLYQYQILVEFDNETASQGQRQTYSKFQDKYGASGIGHEKYGTSTLSFISDEDLTRKDIALLLPEIPVLGFYKKNADKE